MWQFCIEEAAAKFLKIHLPQAMKRAAQATGVSEFTIRKMGNEAPVLDEMEVLRTPGKHHKRLSHRNYELDNFDKCVTRQTIQDFPPNKRKFHL
ncbi:hypothetical protein AVEN_261605-1 [Araneus ventricosus]|uniref:Uncharacterized protein n=1 Tax=Araneus ventricosus TaxID=182803 RepID=A0A4Y2UJL9_ARAVE|nr:hypothetical protein AVEN_219099-1 [Araneus ventricosus]GBO20355.1 hypothetical protein AVEN_261605-1 [Araneus ventricosus]